MTDALEKFGGFPRKFESPNVPGGPMNPAQNKEPEADHDVENEAEAQKYTRRESLSDELISNAETPEELFIGLRQLEKQLEESFIPPDLSERYTPPRQLSAMYERADMLSYKVDELIKRGWIKNYDPETGEATLKDRRYAHLALKTEVKEVQNGRFISQEVKYFFGKGEEIVSKDSSGKEVKNYVSKERENLESAYKRAMVELAARSIMGEHIGLRLSIDVRDSLENLVAILHGGRMPKFKAAHLEAIFNLASVSELATNPENRLLGDMVEKAMFLNLVMLNSGSKQRMLDFLSRPGSIALVEKLAQEWGVTKEQWIHENIGDVQLWEDDGKRLLTDDAGMLATWRVEASDGRRGILTQWSNISAWGGNPGEFSAENEADFIEKIVGGLVGGGKEGIEASWLAATMMRVIGAYASEGYVAIPGKSLLPLGEGRFISGDDTGKFWAYMFNMKEGLKGRKSGLKDMIGKIPDMAMNLFDWAQVEIEEPDENGKLRKVRRSILDAWLGTAKGLKKSLLTGETTKEVVPEEPYHRLGGLNFKSLEREFHGTFTIMQWLMGNAEQPTGVLIDALKTSFQFEKDFTLDNLKALLKYIGIALNYITLTKGSHHLYTDPIGDTKIINKNYLRNLIIARIRSENFAIGTLNSKMKMFTTGTEGEVSVPTPLVVKAHAETVLGDIPGNEQKLLERYIDENKRLRTLGAGEGPGISTDVAAILEEKFEPDMKGKNSKETEDIIRQMTYVGRVTGKNSF